METVDKNCLSYWFPKLCDCGVSVPRTEIVRTEVDFWPWCEGKEPQGIDSLSESISEACQRIGDGPYFFRTGQGSGKHNWKDTCFLASSSPSLIRSHLYALFEWSQMVDFMGLPTDVWVVREMLPVEPIAILERYGNFPLVTEVRGFVADGKIRCSHPYWPLRSIQEGMKHFDDDLASMHFRQSIATDDEMIDVNRLLSTVAKIFDGDGGWSVDVLKTDRGWHVTDMAIAERSFHWPDCKNA